MVADGLIKQLIRRRAWEQQEPPVIKHLRCADSPIFCFVGVGTFGIFHLSIHPLKQRPDSSGV